MNIAYTVTELIGNTPLLLLSRIEPGVKARLLAKIESRNPGGSVKDRIALHMVEEAERLGMLVPGAVIIEPTSGNTGVGLAIVAAVKGYRLILTMPESMSLERRKLLAAYGAELVLTPAPLGMQGAVDEARLLLAQIEGSWMPNQFTNPANPAAHLATACEIWDDTAGEVDAFIACIGTGGTVSGVGKSLKARNGAVQVFGIEPDASPLLSGGHAGAHGIQGIGANFVPETLEREVLDGIIRVKDDDAIATARAMARREGVLCGISGGAAVWGALTLARQDAWQGKTIVTLVPDTGERYLSTALWADGDIKEQ